MTRGSEELKINADLRVSDRIYGDITSTGSNTLATVDINGGNIDGTTIGATTTAAGSFTDINSSGTSTLATVDINGGNIDGTTIGVTTTAAGSFTDINSSGTSTLATVDIDGGNIDGTTIGNTTAANGTFVDISVTGDITISGNLDVNGTTTTVDTENIVVKDSMIKLARDNSSNTVDIGIYGVYGSSATYSGFFRY
jgi:hypothetical protein